MMKRFFHVAATAFLILLLVLPGIPSPISADETGVSEARFARLAKGINLPGWMWLTRREVGDLERRFSSEDLELIHNLGLTHVRVPIDMANVYDSREKELLNPRAVEWLDQGIDKILQHGLAVVVDLHSISQREGGSNYSGPLGEDEKFTESFIRFWSRFAQHLSKHDPERVFLESMNEPVFRQKEDLWPPIQERVIQAIRQNAPRHTILATGAGWSNIHTFVKLQPLADKNIIYNFHFYEPHIFTHQGATWSSDMVKILREVPYPSTPEAVQKPIGLVEDEEAKKALQRYGDERWNADKIGEAIGHAAAWGQTHGVQLTCNEFGAYRNFCLPEYRIPWIHDVRAALEQHHIGWCMWEFDGSFGLVRRENRKAAVDEDVAKALGLKE
ncbi:MAG: glycoside hydrolase family 5 protein [bacterium]